MLAIIILVLWVMVMFLWLLSLVGASPNLTSYSPWLGWFSCLFLGLALFVTGVVPIVLPR